MPSTAPISEPLEPARSDSGALNSTRITRIAWARRIVCSVTQFLKNEFAGAQIIESRDHLRLYAGQSSLNSIREIFLKTVRHESIHAIADFPGVVQNHYGGQRFHFHEGVQAIGIDDRQTPLLALHERHYRCFILIRV